MLSNADKSMLAAIGAMVGQIGDEETRSRLSRALQGEPPPPPPAPIRREVLTAQDVATILGKSVRTVGNYAKKGHIKRAKLPGVKHAFGFTRASVEALAGL